MSTIDLVRGRSTVLNLTNQSGGTRAPGDVVVLDTANSESFTTSASSNSSTVAVGIVDEAIGIGSSGRVVVAGYARQVNVLNTVSRGDYLYTGSPAGSAGSSLDLRGGAFAQVLKPGSGTTPSAHLFGVTPLHVRSIAHTSNTFTGPLTITTPDNSIGVTMPSAGTIALTASVGAATSTPPLAYEAFCSANTTIASASTWTDVTGMSLSLPAGTYDVEAYIFGDDSHAATTSIEVAIHNGTTQVSSSGCQKPAGAGERWQGQVGIRLTLAGTTTVKVQAASTRAGTTVVRTTATFGTGGVANKACRLSATKVTSA